MSPEEEARKQADDAIRERAQAGIDARKQQRAFDKLSPEQQLEVKMLKMVEAAVDRRIARMVIQSGQGVKVTGGNGNWTVTIDPSSLSWQANGVCNGDGTFTITIKGG